MCGWESFAVNLHKWRAYISDPISIEEIDSIAIFRDLRLMVFSAIDFSVHPRTLELKRAVMTRRTKKGNHVLSLPSKTIKKARMYLSCAVRLCLVTTPTSLDVPCSDDSGWGMIFNYGLFQRPSEGKASTLTAAQRN